MSDTKTPLQDGINYKAEIITQICNSQPVMGFLSNDPEISLDSDEAYDLMDTCLYDFDYADTTIERSDAFIMVESDMISPVSGSINSWEVYVQVVCHKKYMHLDSKIYKGVKGNRRDNLTCQVDKLLNGARLFGIGKLELKSCTTAEVPDNFTSKLLTYRVVDFRKERTI